MILDTYRQGQRAEDEYMRRNVLNSRGRELLAIDYLGEFRNCDAVKYARCVPQYLPPSWADMCEVPRRFSAWLQIESVGDITRNDYAEDFGGNYLQWRERTAEESISKMLIDDAFVKFTSPQSIASVYR
jgi:hypothetical protein